MKPDCSHEILTGFLYGYILYVLLSLHFLLSLYFNSLVSPRFFWHVSLSVDDANSISGCTWGPVPLAVRTTLTDFIHLALLVQTSGNGNGRDSSLSTLARHRSLPELPKGQCHVSYPHSQEKAGNIKGRFFMCRCRGLGCPRAAAS